MLPKQSPTTYQNIRGLRTVRNYRSVPLTDRPLTQILEAGRWTGSSKNSQPWAMVVVADRDRLEKVASCGYYTDPVRKSVATVVLIRLPKGGDFDIGRLAQNLMLAAAALGVGSCPVTLHKEEKVRKLLGVPDDHGCRYAVTLGYTDGAAETAFRRASSMGGRRPLAELVRRERFGG
ncbi:MAG TPA: nitroreductase family protein [Acidimicrobiia bacterium]|nr:nitroreductase family protein [Acidimicrobiia bacterium]